MESVLRFWLDRGVDGFRIDVAHGLVKERGPSRRRPLHEIATPSAPTTCPMWDQPGVHDIYRRWRKITDSYAVDGRGRRPDPVRARRGWSRSDVARALRARRRAAPVVQLRLPDERRGSPREMRRRSTDSLAAGRRRTTPRRPGCSPTTTWSGTPRGSATTPVPGPAADAGHRCRRPPAGRGGRPATSTRGDHRDAGAAGLGVPLPGRGARPARGDPAARRRARGPDLGESGHTTRGRDGCRVPIPWEGDAPSYGFGPSEPSLAAAAGRCTVTSPSTARPGSKGRPSSSTARCCACVASSDLGRGELTWVDLGESTRWPSTSAPSRVLPCA